MRCGVNRRSPSTSPGRPSFAIWRTSIMSQQRFIATMQGRTATFSTFNDAQFDEAAFEAQLTDGRMPTMICWYWILKAEGAVPVGRLCRGARGSRQCDSPALVLNRPLSACSTTITTLRSRWRRFMMSASPDAQAAMAQPLEAHQNNSANGPTTIRRLSATSTHWCRPRLPALRAATLMPCGSTSRPFDRPTIKVSCRTRAWPMRWLRVSMRRAALK